MWYSTNKNSRIRVVSNVYMLPPDAYFQLISASGKKHNANGAYIFCELERTCLRLAHTLACKRTQFPLAASSEELPKCCRNTICCFKKCIHRCCLTTTYARNSLHVDACYDRGIPFFVENVFRMTDLLDKFVGNTPFSFFKQYFSL